MKIKCPDGQGERIVFKNPDHAFPLMAKDWSAKFNAVCKALKEFEGSIGGQFEKQTEGFFIQLDQANFSMQSHFRAIYVVYLTDPCKLNDFLTKEINKIIKTENKHRKMAIEINRIKMLVSSGLKGEELAQTLMESQKKLLLL